MDTRDFVDPEGNRIDRLEAVKQVLDDFIARREGDRIGLIVFGDAAHLQVPFTLDHDTCRLLLDQTRIGMVGQQTMLGDAIGLAIQLFEAGEAEERVLILLTDGNDTGSKVPPTKAARIAADRGVTIHTVGVGDPAASGDDLVDVEALQGVASVTGGQAFMAENRSELEEIYAQLDAIEPQEINTLSYRPRTPLFQYPVGAATVLIFVYHLIMALAASLRRRRVRHA
jgi:Ca-activated chloride channel family protein